MTRVISATALTFAALVAAQPSEHLRAQTGHLRSLATLFDLGSGLVRDTNGDGLADEIAARVVLPAGPAAEEVQAATNIAGRLGFETTAATFPVVVNDDAQLPKGAFPILVGAGNRTTAELIKGGRVSLKSLAAGQGIIALVRGPAGDALVVAGGDAAGTLAAANVLASRLPRIWSATGITIKGIEERTAAVARAAGVNVTSAALHQITVEPERRGIGEVRVALAVADAARARRVFEDLDARHRHGLDAASLNFANVAATVVELGPGTSSTVAVRRSGFNPRTLTPPIDPDELAPDSPGERGAREGRPIGPTKNYDLADVYSIEGWLGDNYTDLIPDRTETTIVIDDASEGVGAAHIAARIGLETTGITLPITRAPKSIQDPQREGNLILMGRSNALTKDLEKIGKVSFADLQPGDGLVQLVPRAFSGTPATIVAGSNAAATETAALHLARRLPHLWAIERGSPTLADLEREATRFFAAKTGAAQTSAALSALQEIARDLKAEDIESIEAKLFLETVDPQVEKFLADRLRGRFKIAGDVKVTAQATTDAVPVFEEKLDVPWEVDEFWTRFRENVLPTVNRGASVELESRLSESPEVRRQIADQAKAELERAGAKSADVKIRSAYKQGFLWLSEEVIPQLKSRGVRSVRIKVLSSKPDLSKKFKFYEVPSRWLHELYPIDDVVHRELGIPSEAVSLELVDEAPDVYTVDALDASGKSVFTAAFSPKFVEREYLEKFPGWSRVRVTTGWIAARVNGASVIDARIATDPERFWDHYQAKVLPRIYDHVMKVTDNKPLPDKQPFHRDFDIEVWMSEPDFRIGIDEEQVSSLESLHEDLYFVTLDFFDALGRTTTKRRLAAPGKIFPIIHPPRPGRAGEVRILFAGNASPKPRLEVSYKTKGSEKPTKVTRDLAGIESPAVMVLRTVVRPEKVAAIGLQIELKDDKEATRAADLLDGLIELHAAGLYRTALSYDHVDRVVVTLASKDARAERTIANTGTFAPSPVRTASARPTGPVVTWDHVISPDESEEIVGKLSGYPEIRSYVAGTSYRGRQISAMEVTLPSRGELVAPLKLAALKPTILITGRQHANEVSSTSHILRLAELLATDPAYKRMLTRVNVILHPVENPDGAQMAYELQKLTPTHMLHAGRYSALGMDVQSQVNEPDPLLPEALVRGRLWREWLPDVYLNPHGYPSHEWVQQFAGYVPPGFRTYWSSRGWYTSVSGLRDPRYPEHPQAVAALREAIVREINSNPDVRAMNLRHQARYRKWAFGFAPHTYGQEIYKETAIYYGDPETGEPSGSRRAGASRFGGGSGRPGMAAWPQVTFFSGGTEAPDETAQGPWLNLVTRAGFSYLMASLSYLRDGRYTVERIAEEGQRDSVSHTLLRVRPVLPGEAKPAETAATR